MQNVFRFVRLLSFCGLIAAGVLIVGCDSGGSASSSSGGEPSGGENTLENTSAVTADLKANSSSSSREKTSSGGAKASGTLAVGFHYENSSGSDCTLSVKKTVGSTPYNEPFDPTNISGSCSDPSEFDGVQAEFTPGSGSSASGLVLRLLNENGTEITSDDDPSGGLSVSETASDQVDLPDEIGGGGEGGDNDGGSDGDTTAPSAPSGLFGKAETGTVELSWSAVGAGDLSGYNVYRSTSPINDVSGKSPLNGSPLLGTSYTDDGAENGTTYHYSVTAIDESGNESTASNEVTATLSGSDGSGRIAFRSRRGLVSVSEIHTIAPNGADLKQLTDPNGFYKKKPTWSPDGSQVAFLRVTSDGQVIYTVDSDGSDLNKVTGNGYDDSDPAWSPDGNRIAFYSRRDGGAGIYTIRPDGSDLNRIVGKGINDSNPTWAPSGNRIAFDSPRGEGLTDDIYTIRLDGSGLERVTNNNSFDQQPVWSPNGNRIAFIKGIDDNSEIYTIRPDGSDLNQVTKNGVDESSTLAWSPDGNRIAFVSRRDGDPEVYTIRPDGSDLKQLTENDASDRDPAWR